MILVMSACPEFLPVGSVKCPLYTQINCAEDHEDCIFVLGFKMLSNLEDMHVNMAKVVDPVEQ